MANQALDIESEGLAADRDLDELYRAMGDAHRRAVLRLLAPDPPEPIPPGADEIGLEQLVTALAESGFEDSLPHRSPEELRALLHHVHLPRLADVGAIEYDPSDQTVTVRDHPLVDAF